MRKIEKRRREPILLFIFGRQNSGFDPSFEFDCAVQTKKERDPTCALSLTVVIVVVIVVVFLFLNLSKAKRQSRLLSNRWQKAC